MNRTISSDDIRQQWDSIIEITKGGDDVIVEARGEPQAVVISPETYEELKKAQEKQRRAEDLEWLRDFEKRQLELNQDLTAEEVDEIAIRVGREVNAAVTKKWRAQVERQNAK